MSQASLGSTKLAAVILHRKRLRRELLDSANLTDIRIAILGGTTTNEVVDLLEITLLQSGFRPTFYQSEYGKYYEDAVFNSKQLAAFNPDIVYIHTSVFNILNWPPISCDEKKFSAYVEAELGRYLTIWKSLAASVGCQIIQNNFEFPVNALLGNLDTISAGGATRFISELNRRLSQEARDNNLLSIQDICTISARIGLNQWFDLDRWYSYKIVSSVEASYAVACSIAAIVRAIYGRTRKVLVLDLDNTLWGGIIGDDGLAKIALGRETPLAEAYTAFQEYCLSLRERGILLAVCSKNDDKIAKEGFTHPDSVLKLEHFSAFRANWEPKHENILAIARELNLSTDSFVFIDDNPSERALVSAQIPGIAVPDVGCDVTRYVSILEMQRYFEPFSLGMEDLERAKLYADNTLRVQLEIAFSDYGEYLDSLQMRAEIEEFLPAYMERIVQLTNKTNQFNLTTKRYTLAELLAAIEDGQHIGIYGKLTDRFGENGLISVLLGRIDKHQFHIDLWLMSCRVLKRDMELAMLDSIVCRVRSRGVNMLIGYYYPTSKNGLVADHYQTLGFTLILRNEETGSCVYSLDISHYATRNSHIHILMETTHG